MAAGTLVRTAMLKITADDGDTESKLSLITERAKELARLHPELTPRINTAAASAKLKVLKAELSDTQKQADETGGRMAALGSAVNLFATGGLSGGVSEMGAFQKAMFAMNVATGVGEPLLAGLIVAAGGLAAGFAAAGAGVGIFGEVAKGVWGQVQQNITAYAKASNAIAAGDTGKKLIADNKALKAALEGLTGPQQQLVIGASNASVQWHNFLTGATSGVNSVLLPALAMVPKALQLITPFLAPVEAALRGIVAQVSSGLSSGGLKSFLGDLSANAGPAITKIATAIGHVVVGIGGILKAFMPVSQGMLAGLDKITAKFATWGQTLPSHSGFQSLMTMAKTDAPLVISALQKLGNIAKIVGGQMTAMSGFGNSKMFLQTANAVLQLVDSLLKAHPQLVYLALYAKMGADGIGKLKTVFSGIGGALSGIGDAAKSMSNLSKGMKDSDAAASEATGAWGTFGGKLSSVGSTMKSAFTSIGSGLAQAGSSVASFAAQTGRQLAMAARATIAWVAEHAVAAGTFIAENVAMAVSATAAFIAENAATLGLVAGIALLVAGIIYLATHWRQVWADIQKVAVAAWHFIDSSLIQPLMAGIGAVIDWIKSHWVLLVAIFTGPIGLVVSFVISHWNQILTVTKNLIGDVTSFFRSLPGKIVSALGNVGNLLRSAGANVIRGLVNGIESMFGAVESAIKRVAGLIPKGLSDVLHMLSPSRVTHDQGVNVGRGLINGMASMEAPVTTQARRLGTAATPGGFGAAGGGAGGAGMTVQIGTSGGDGPVLNALVTALKKDIRINFGGDVTRWARTG